MVNQAILVGRLKEHKEKLRHSIIIEIESNLSEVQRVPIFIPESISVHLKDAGLNAVVGVKATIVINNGGLEIVADKITLLTIGRQDNSVC